MTFGCRLNAYESEAMRARAAEAGLGNAIIFNTCAVTGEAVRQSRQAIRKTRRENPGAKIIVTGCAAQTEPDTYAQMAEVDAVLGNAEKLETASYADFGVGAAERVRVNDIMSVTETAAQFVDSFEGRARAFVQVQNGCDHRCTFCIIPYGRGNSRSVPMGAVVDEARRLVAAGFPELVLTGVDLTSYGADLPGRPSLGQLVRKILTLVPELPRLRLSSIDSIEADDALLRVIAEEAAADAAFPSLGAGRRRHDPQAHEAPPSAPSHHRILPRRAPPQARGRVRRRSDRRLSHRNRGDGREHAPACRTRPGSPISMSSPSAPDPERPPPACPSSPAKPSRPAPRGCAPGARRPWRPILPRCRPPRRTCWSNSPAWGRTACYAPVRFSGAAETGQFVTARITGATQQHLIGTL